MSTAPISATQDIARCLLRIFVVFPMTGAVLGAISAVLSIVLFDEGHPSRLEYYWFLITDLGLPFGAMTGFVFAIPVVWSLRRRSYFQILQYMGVGTLIGGATGLIGGPGISWWAGMFGYWIGYVLLFSSSPEDSRQRKPTGT